MNTFPAAIRITVSALMCVASLSVQAQTAVTDQRAPLAAVPLTLPPQVTISALMKDTINPAARALWTAVSYTATAEGVTETMPETEDDWNVLRARADELMRAGAMLMLPGLKVDELSAIPPNYQYTPAEIERLIQQDPGVWRNYAERMQTTVLQLIGAIEKRDLTTFMELSPPINQACEGCHSQYWYRPMPR